MHDNSSPMYKTIYQEGRAFTILKVTKKLRNRKKYSLCEVGKTRSGSLLIGDHIKEMTAKAFRKMAKQK